MTIIWKSLITEIENVYFECLGKSISYTTGFIIYYIIILYHKINGCAVVSTI